MMYIELYLFINSGKLEAQADEKYEYIKFQKLVITLTRKDCYGITSTLF